MNAVQSKHRCQNSGYSLRFREIKKCFLLFLLIQTLTASAGLVRRRNRLLEQAWTLICFLWFPVLMRKEKLFWEHHE